MKHDLMQMRYETKYVLDNTLILIDIDYYGHSIRI